jgi:hypothetical protein
MPVEFAHNQNVSSVWQAIGQQLQGPVLYDASAKIAEPARRRGPPPLAEVGDRTSS